MVIMAKGWRKASKNYFPPLSGFISETRTPGPYPLTQYLVQSSGVCHLSDLDDASRCINLQADNYAAKTNGSVDIKEDERGWMT